MEKVIKKAFYVCFLMSLFIISSTQVRGSQITPTTLGEKITVASSGRDPDIAVDTKGNLHLVYVRGENTYYCKVLAPYTEKENIGTEFLVGSGGGLFVTGGGSNPQIALDSNDAPHIVFGFAMYTYWNGNGFTTPIQALDGWMKNLIAIDREDRVYIIANRYLPRNILLRVYKDGKPFENKGAVILGPDNPGGADIGADNILHFTYRIGLEAYHNTYDLKSGLGTTALVIRSSSDFTFCSFDWLTNTIHVVATKAWGAGIGYIAKRNNQWGKEQVFGNPIWIDDPDNVNPVSTNDARGYTYVTYAGSEHTGWYFVINEKDEIIGGVDYLDFDDKTYAGYKTTNPNVASNPTQNGAFVSWGTDAVYVRSIGVVDDVTYVPAINLLLRKKNGAPTDITLSRYDIDENVPVNSTVGLLSSIDPDDGDTFAYTLVSGEGDTDNESFNINSSDNSLQINEIPDYERQKEYFVRVRTTDQGGLTYEENFTITINDMPENDDNPSGN